MVFPGNRPGGPIAMPNLTPLVDVMLVVLVVVVATFPMLQRPLVLPLPQATWCGPEAYAPRPPPIELSLDAANHLRWNGVPLPLGAVAAQLQVFSTLPAQQRPTVRLRTTGDTDYQALSEVMVAVDNAGLMSGLGIDADD